MIYVYTHAGKRHVNSEDTVLVGNEILTGVSGVFPMPEKGFVCVADGVGGNRGGAQASQFVLGSLANHDIDEATNLKELLTGINNALLDASARNPGLYGMATTLTGMLLSADNTTLFHVGNTRAYIKQGRYLKQITQDHTTYNWLLSCGRVEAAESCRKNEITNCFGGNDRALLSKLYITEINPFSLALLTSDGIHDHVDPDLMENIIFGEGDYMAKCRSLADEAVLAGSDDDISVVIICPSE